jgi:hypothetical protein
MNTYTSRTIQAQRDYGFSHRKALDYVLHRWYNNCTHEVASYLSEQSADRYHLSQSTEHSLLLTGEMVKGYSRSQLTSVMAVLDCDLGVAKDVCDAFDPAFDWSEATWEEVYAEANATLGMLWERHFTETVN